MTTAPKKRGPVPRGFRPGAALAPGSTPIARLYEEHAALFDEVAAAVGEQPKDEVDRLVDEMLTVDRRILEAPCTKLADLGAKARVLAFLSTMCGENADARIVFEIRTREFLAEVQVILGGPCDRASGVACN
ncbi:MAG: hypothetical protein OEL76_13060 [Siculibacillus sp.]|nr:hypothetical protein [Siculibacillus sp.]